MSMPNYLAKIKSAGVYRYVFDKSAVPTTERNSLRLVVGYSERGPFNSPVFIKDAPDFISTFGNISRRMERKGVFFHRLALQALEAGPILALNIKPFKNESAKMISFNASDIRCDKDMKVKAVADSVELTAYKRDGSVDDKVAKRFFVKPVPDYGFVMSARKKSLELEFVGSKSADAKYIRTIEKGKEIYWSVPNGSTGQAPADKVHGASISGGKVTLAHFDYSHNYFNGSFVANSTGEITVKGAQTDLKDELIDDALVALDGTNVAGEKLYTIYDTNRFWKVTNNLMDISPLAGDAASKRDYMRIVQTSSKEDSVTVFMRPYVPAGYNIKIADWYAQETTAEMPSYMDALKDHYLSEFFMEIYVFRGDFRSSNLFTSEGTLGSYVKNADGTSTFQAFCDVTGEGTQAKVMTNPNYADPHGRFADALDAMADCATSNFVGKYQGIMFPGFTSSTGEFISIDQVFNSDYAAHKCLMALNEQLLDDAYEADLNDNDIYDKGTEQAPQDPIEGNHVGVSDLVHKLCSAVHGTQSSNAGDVYSQYDPLAVPPVNASVAGYYLEGYNYTTILRNESGRSLVEDKIMAVLGYKGIQEALTNNVDVDYKYWVDTFQGYPGIAMKSAITSIAKQKFNALAILNFPPMVDCATYIGYPGLVGGFDMKEVVKRGSGITLPAEVQGASWAAYYTQLQMSEGTNKFVIPSAGLVSNLFVNKWSVRQPYYIVAGPNYGRIDYNGVVGPDYNYSRNDLDQLEPFGVNAIIYVPRKGVIINSNQTAKQTPVTALSKIHVRELVTYLQDTVEDMLRGYQWEFNTSTLRDAVRSKCETYCELIKANGGIYDFRVVCDSSNNTPEVIDNEMLVVDLEIEPTRGSGKMVQTLTIHRTGGIGASPKN